MRITENTMFNLLMAARNNRNPLLAGKMANKMAGNGQTQPQHCLAEAMGLSAADINHRDEEAPVRSGLNQIPWPIMRRMSVEALNGLVKELTGHDISEWDGLPRAEYMRKLDGTRGSAENVPQAMEDIARRYAELREGILSKFKDNEDEMYMHLGELNIAFEVALKKSGAIITLGAHERSTTLMLNNSEERWAYKNGTDADRARTRREFEAMVHAQNTFNRNMMGLAGAYNQSMMGHMDAFFEAFINSIKTNDFDTAFAESMAALNGGASKSLNNMSFSDAVKIREAFAGGSMFFDEAGESRAALNRIIGDNSISMTVRQTAASRFGLRMEM